MSVFAALASFVSDVQARDIGAISIAVALPTSGDEAGYGEGALRGIQLAIEEANADTAEAHIELTIYDDRSSDDGAKEVAGQIVSTNAALVLGPTFSTASLNAGPVYAAAGLASLPLTATSDLITQNATTFRVIFKNTDQGETLAIYLSRVLHQQQADVIVVDNAYGRTLREGFERTAVKLGIEARYFLFTTPAEAEQIAQKIGADASKRPIVMLTLDGDAARLLTTLRRLGTSGPFLGGDALGDTILSDRLIDLPEERLQRGFFTNDVYAVSPMILDSANANTLAFAERYRSRFGRDPVWQATVGYDAGRLAATAARAALAEVRTKADTQALRAAVLKFLTSLDSPARAVPALLGAIWFDQTRGRQQAIRIGRFNRGNFESAPVQIVPVTAPDAAEVASGAVFEMGTGRFARLQRVVYSGVFINEIPRVDLTRSSFNADFYLWLRFAHDAGPDSADPTDINFPTMLSGSFDRKSPAEQREMADGTEYRLWRVQGEFRNDYDLHKYPFDRQKLSLGFFNSRAAADRIVYALDGRLALGDQTAARLAGVVPSWRAEPPGPPLEVVSIASPQAFRNLTQWNALGAQSLRENLVTNSALGDPARIDVHSGRELSGFLVNVEIERRAVATLGKSLLPLLLMTLIMYASLYFPAPLVKEKVTVAITGALSGAVLLSAINSQLGSVGYTIAVEYVFYVFFALALLCVVSVLGAERLRSAGRTSGALVTEVSTRYAFLFAVAVTVAGGVWLALSAR